MASISKLLGKLTGKVERIRHLNDKRRSWLKPLANLFRDQASINQTLSECIEAQAAALDLLANPKQPAKKAPPVPTFDGDNFVTYRKSVHWMEDPAFQAAYRAGMYSGHKLRGDDGSIDSVRLEWRTHIILWAAANAARLEGDFVECGVNTGIFSLAICYYLNFASVPKKFWLFDTYCGIPISQADGDEAERVEAMNKVHYEDCFEIAKRNFARYPNAVLVKGMVPDTLPQCTADKVAYLSIDMNIAEPELAAMEYFWPKLVTGAVVVLDDYGFFGYEKQRAVLDDFARRHGVMIATLPTGQGLLIKS